MMLELVSLVVNLAYTRKPIAEVASLAVLGMSHTSFMLFCIFTFTFKTSKQLPGKINLFFAQAESALTLNLRLQLFLCSLNE